MPDSTLFQLFADDDYRFGPVSVRVYDRTNISLYSDDLLYRLYRAARPDIRSTFCGVDDLSADSIIAYLHTRKPLLLACLDNPKSSMGFDIIGFAFASRWAGWKKGAREPDTGRACHLGYCFFRPYWGKPEISVAMMLIGVYFFQEFDLSAINGERYEHNRLTRKFLAQFGVVDTGYVPYAMMYEGKLVKCVLSSLSREDFTAYVHRTLIECSQSA